MDSMTQYAVISGDFVSTGGMDKANLALAKHLVSKNIPLHIVAHRLEPSLIECPHVTFHRVPRPLRSNFLGAPLLRFVGESVGNSVQASGGRVVANGGNCSQSDANWIHYVHAAFRPLNNAACLRSERARLSHWLAVRDEASCAKGARLIICNSRLTKTHLVEFLNISEKQIRVVYYGCDPVPEKCSQIEDRTSVVRELQIEEASPVVGFIGALGDNRKGFDTLYRAWKTLTNQHHWNGALLVIGQGSDLASWRGRALADRLSSIKFLGFRTDVARLLTACSLLVQPARYEAYGLAAQEALSRGIPVIVSSCSGIEERYPSALRALVLKDAENDDELAELMSHWFKNQNALKQATESFSVDLLTRTWHDMAAEILAEMKQS